MAYPKGEAVSPALRYRLQAALVDRHTSQEFAARTMRISRQLFNEILNGRERVAPITMRRLLAWLGNS